MKNLLNFLIETNYTYTVISIDEVNEKYIDLVHKSKKIPTIYRGFASMVSYGFADNRIVLFDPTNFKRKSLNTANIYNLYLSEIDPNWKKFPPRNKSLSCSFNKIEASYYTQEKKNLFLVIPLNLNENIGICPEEDFWISFSKITKLFNLEKLDFDLNLFNQLVANLITYSLGFDDFNSREIFYKKENLLSVLKEMEEKIQNDPELENFVNEVGNNKHKILFEFFKKHGVLNGLKILFDPEENGFELTPYQNIPKSYINVKKECWISGKCLLVRSK